MRPRKLMERQVVRLVIGLVVWLLFRLVVRLVNRFIPMLGRFGLTEKSVLGRTCCRIIRILPKVRKTFLQVHI